jgi:3-hydroxyethyl bacteriochlorophyllide a dehydrogenase
MPHFPGMGYPLVPGYESVGRVIEAGRGSGYQAGARVFVPGARCFGDIRGLFGGAAARVVVPGARVLALDDAIGEQGVLLALAATAQHAVVAGDAPPGLIVGHGVLGRLIARLAVIAGGNPVVWERNPARCGGAEGYEVREPAHDAGSLYHTICDASGSADLIDGLVQRLTPGGEIVLAGFYTGRLSFAFAPAFMREARLRIAAQWAPADLAAVRGFVASGQLSLDGLITHRSQAMNAPAAYRTAFEDSACLKMVLDWRDCA